MAWKYQDVLNQDLAILLTIALGFLSLLLKVFERNDATVFSKFLFKFTLAASVIQGLGLKTDLYNGDIWAFVGAFLILRTILLLACGLVCGLGLKQSLGEVTATWMAISWISTVILGTPILKALLGQPYANLGVVAGISSFIYQLPLMLVLFEVHSWRQSHLHATLPETQQPQQHEAPGQASDEDPQVLEAKPQLRTLRDSASLEPEPYHPAAPDKQEHSMGRPGRAEQGLGAADGDLMKGSSGTDKAAGLACQDSNAPPHHENWTVGVGNFKLTKAQLAGIGLRLLKNHALWGCLIGLILSLSKVGPRWLNPEVAPGKPNCTYAIGAGFIALLLDYFARCTEPVALFATGMWMHQKNPLCCGFVQSVLYMVIKLVLVPLLMVGCAFMVGLDGAYGRAAVLVAALPVSSATFALCKTYGVGEKAAIANVVLGNLLVLPTTIAWLSVMDALDLFVTGPLKAGPNPCNASPAKGS